MSIYRKEVIDNYLCRGYGKPFGRLPVSWFSISIMTTVFVIAAIIFLFSGTYSRKENVSGYLKPLGFGLITSNILLRRV